MTDATRSEDGIRRIDDALREWRQGDVALDADLFVDMRAATSGGSEPDVGTSEVRGLVILTQTCDIARASTERPWVEVAPILEITDPERMAAIERLELPRFAVIPTLRADRLVAHLDRSMTIDKALLVSWRRTPGWRTDAEERRFREALARKRSRPAFDDDFGRAIEALSTRLRRNHGKRSPAGHATDALSEIRVQASPAWEDPDVEVFFWFIHDTDEEGESIDWEDHVEKWLALIAPTGRFQLFAGAATTLDDMTARDYVDSDRLDLDRLSCSQGPENG